MQTREIWKWLVGEATWLDRLTTVVRRKLVTRCEWYETGAAETLEILWSVTMASESVKDCDFFTSAKINKNNISDN
jgi:hypothetical protein